MENILDIKNREEFRAWLAANYNSEKECFIAVKRGRPIDNKQLWYLDAVEEALCFGWIDSVAKKIDGVDYQRFSPRRKYSNWTEQNKERVRRLEKLGMMTDAGRAVLPDMLFIENDEVIQDLQDAGVLEIFRTFPELYQRIRLYNLDFYKRKIPAQYENKLNVCIKNTKAGKMYGTWDDYGRLTKY